MNSELSRVETYRKNRKKTPVKKAPSAGAAKRTPPKSKAAETSSTRAAGTLRRGKTAGKAGKRPAAARTAAAASVSAAPQSRRSNRTAGNRETADESTVPARADTYGSRRIKISKYFTNSLIFLFIGLTAFLVYWGIKGAPPLEDLW
ncbi:cobalamin biosynthesis Mg chelatase CobN [Paenibacillus favisporus]|uniref:Cobalamin biosynthesis Mg chelatase CobN n=1 Tax=Paenibacillus favisporus TaxID=221028 RepID=A0ABV2EWH7_9BACL